MNDHFFGYSRRKSPIERFIRGVLLYTFVIVLGVFYGTAAAILPPKLIYFLIFPIATLLALALWTIEDAHVNFDKIIIRFLFGFISLSMIWPAYIAVSIPGLPWLNPQKLFLFALFSSFILSISQSKGVRTEINYIFSKNVIFSKFYIGFICIQFLTIFISRQIFQSAGETFNDVLLHCSLLVMSAYVFYKIRDNNKLSQIWTRGFIVSITLAFIELYLKRTFWSEYIPNYFIADPVLFENYVSASYRYSDGIYRVKSVFGNPVYFAQFLAIGSPFLIANLFRKDIGKKLWLFYLLLIICTIYVSYSTNSRTALIGLLIGAFSFLVLIGVKIVIDEKEEGFKRSLIAASGPAILFVTFFIAALSHRARTKIFGGQQHEGSDDSREQQFTNAFNVVAENPFGHGTGSAAELAGVPSQMGPILDARFLNIIVDYGVLGALFFYFSLVSVIVLTVKIFLRSTKSDNDLLASACSVLVFIFTSFTVSSGVLLPLFYVTLGACLGKSAHYADMSLTLRNQTS
jgi:O-antigen ligase